MLLQVGGERLLQSEAYLGSTQVLFQLLDGVVRMLKSAVSLSLVAVIAIVAASLRADEEQQAPGKCGSAACATGKCAGACSEATAVAKTAETCPMTVAMEKLPKMVFVVGGEETCCPTSAGELAEKSGKKVHYVVAKKEFDDEAKAQAALLKATEAFVAAFAEPKKCSVSGKVTVAGKEHCCENGASATSKLVKAAMDKVQMSYKVGDESCHCPNEAAKLAKDSGKEKIYVVGDVESCCDVTARLHLARAKYMAAVKALQDPSETH
jgi:hypothetical protein